MSHRTMQLLAAIGAFLIVLLIAGAPLAYEYFAVERGEMFEMEGVFERVEVAGYTTAITKYNFRSVFTLEEGKTPWVGGAWNGPLPQRGTHVTISSPTGFMRDVVIVDTNTGETYYSEGLSLKPERQLFEYRVTLRATGDVLCQGVADGFDSFEATERARCDGQTLYSMSFYDRYVIQIWDQGATAPPIFKP